MLKVCKYCSKKFEVSLSKRKQKYCDGVCREKALKLERKMNALQNDGKMKEVRKKFGMRENKSYLEQLRTKIEKDNDYKCFEKHLKSLEKELHKN